MKHNFILLAAMAAIAVTSSCTDDNAPVKTIETSDATPIITITEGDQFDLSPEAMSYKLHVHSNVTLVTSEGNGVGYLRYNNESDLSDKANLIGDNIVNVSNIGNKNYTTEGWFSLVQSVWYDKYIDYTGYGLVETPIYFRVRGEKGTNYVVFFADEEEGEKYYKNEGEKPYYLKGELKNISEVTKGSEDITCGKTYAIYFKDWGYTPTLTKADVEKVVLTIATETGDVSIEVVGRTRDNEMGKLLNRIKAGDTVEVPAGRGTWNNIKKKEFSAVRPQQVFVL